MRKNIVTLGITLLVTAAIASTLAVRADDSPETLIKSKLQREISQRRLEERKRQETNLEWVSSQAIDGRSSSSPNFDSPVFHESSIPATDFSSASSNPPPPASPGLQIGTTAYDYQHNNSQGYQTARTSGADIVHFVWMEWARLPVDVNENDRRVTYNSYSISGDSLNQGPDGAFIALGALARAGYINMDVGTNNEASVSCHQREDPSLPYNPWHLDFPIPGSVLRVSDGLGGYATGGCPEVLWPRNAASRDAANTGVRHLIAHSNTNDCPIDLLWYWRYNGAAWTGPVIVDSTPQISYVITDDPNSDKLAVGVHVSNYTSMNGINNVAYMQSTTNGAGWIANTEAKTKTVLTNYNSDAGPGAWLHISCTYDNSSVLHIVWDEQHDANDDALTAIRHWNSSRNTIRSVALNYAETPLLTGVFNLNLTKVTMGIGDGGTVCGSGTNNDYVYVAYTKFGGSTLAEQEDASVQDRYNGELYLSVSNSGGNTWAPPVNLSDTKTPRCNPGLADTSTGIPLRPDSVCRSEHWATIGRVVDDIDIFFVSDLDAGGIPQGEGTWQMNPVHYLRIPGGTANALHVCPLVDANYVATLSTSTECEYHAPQASSTNAIFSLFNLGNGTMSGTITVTDFPGAPTLSLSGGGGAYSISDGSPEIVKTATMASNGAPEGLYIGQISVTHNDPSQTSPQDYPIEFFVFNNFFCPKDEVLKTGVASPGSLALEVESNGRFASQNPEGGLWRYKDSSSTIFDGSLLISHGTQVDTTVFMRFGSRNSNGQFGFRAQGDMEVDTTAYGTGTGYACATAQMSTRDSVVGIKVEWVFPQDPSLDDIVLVKYKLTRHNPSVNVSNLAIGILLDANAIPATRLGRIQSGVTNQPGSDAARNLVWVGGVDTVGHTIVGTNTATRFRGGVASSGSASYDAGPSGFEGAIVGNNVSDIQLGGGPTDGFLYSGLQNLAGMDLYSVTDTDLYVMLALDKGRSIGAGADLDYVLVYASDTISEASFKGKIDAGLALVANGFLSCGCSCPNWADPQPDGIRSNAQDVVITVNVAFRGVAAVTDPDCPIQRSDVNNDGVTNAVDLVKVVNVAFRGQTVASQYVNPIDFPCDTGTTPPPPTLSLGDSVRVESRIFGLNQAACTIGVFITNDVDIQAIVIPLELRSTSGGAYINNTITSSNLFNVYAAGRVNNSPLGIADPGGLWPAANITRGAFNAPAASNTCSGPTSSTWAIAANNFASSSPDAVLFASVSVGDPGINEEIFLAPGADGPARSQASFRFVFNTNGSDGRFEIDTCCRTPQNHLAFVDVAGDLIRPTFTKGAITVGNPPPSTLTPPLMSIVIDAGTGSDLVVKWTQPDMTDVTDFEIAYGSSSTLYEIDTLNEPANLGNGPYKKRIPGLQEQSIYHVAVRAHNQATGSYSAWGSMINGTRPTVPVVLIHGWNSDPEIWNDPSNTDDFLQWMKDDGFNHVWLVDNLNCGGVIGEKYFSGNTELLTRFIEDSTESLQLQSEGVVVTRVDVIGHSMGGLIARRYVEGFSSEWGRQVHIRNLVMLGSPNLGSSLAPGGPNTSSDAAIIQRKKDCGNGPAYWEISEQQMLKFNLDYSDHSGTSYFAAAGWGGFEADNDCENVRNCCSYQKSSLKVLCPNDGMVSRSSALAILPTGSQVTSLGLQDTVTRGWCHGERGFWACVFKNQSSSVYGYYSDPAIVAAWIGPWLRGEQVHAEQKGIQAIQQAEVQPQAFLQTCSSIMAGDVKAETVTVETGHAWFTLVTDEPRLALRAISPTGTIWDSISVTSGPNTSFYRDPFGVGFEFSNVEQGQWIVIADAESAIQLVSDFCLSGHVASGIVCGTGASKSYALRGEEVLLHVSLTADGASIPAATVTGSCYIDSTLVMDSVSFEDNGLNDDAFAGDGIYSAGFDADDSGAVTVKVSARGESVPYGDFSRDATIIFLVLPSSYQTGDMNHDGIFNVVDVVELINHVFRAAPAPTPPQLADVSCDGIVNIVDVVGLINHIFRGGPQPACP